MDPTTGRRRRGRPRNPDRHRTLPTPTPPAVPPCTAVVTASLTTYSALIRSPRGSSVISLADLDPLQYDLEALLVDVCRRRDRLLFKLRDFSVDVEEVSQDANSISPSKRAIPPPRSEPVVTSYDKTVPLAGELERGGGGIATGQAERRGRGNGEKDAATPPATGMEAGTKRHSRRTIAAPNKWTPSGSNARGTAVTVGKDVDDEEWSGRACKEEGRAEGEDLTTWAVGAASKQPTSVPRARGSSRTVALPRQRGRPPLKPKAPGMTLPRGRPSNRRSAMTPSMRKGLSYDYKTKFWRTINVYCRDLNTKDLEIIQVLQDQDKVATEVGNLSRKPFASSWAENDIAEERECSSGGQAGKRKASRPGATDVTPDVLRLVRQGEAACKRERAAAELERDNPLYRRLAPALAGMGGPTEEREEALQVDASMDLETRLRARLGKAGLLKGEAACGGKPDDEITARMRQVEHDLRAATALRTQALHNLRTLATREIARADARRRLITVNKEIERVYVAIQDACKATQEIGKREGERARKLLAEREVLIAELEERTRECDELRGLDLFETPKM